MSLRLCRLVWDGMGVQAPHIGVLGHKQSQLTNAFSQGVFLNIYFLNMSASTPKHAMT